MVIIVAIVVISQFINPSQNSNSNAPINNASSSQGNYYLKKGELFCGTESQLDEQMKWLAQSVMKFAPGCFSSAADIEVVVIDWGLTVKGVRGVNNGQMYWVASESIVRK